MRTNGTVNISMRILSFLKLFFPAVFFFAALASCNSKLKQGNDMPEAEKKYIRALGLLDTGEQILLYDRQSAYEQSGNFFTGKRIASYWIDKNDTAKNTIDFAYYADVDTMRTNDRSHAMTYASWLEVTRHDGSKFNVYVDGDSAEVWTFFNKALSEWRTKRNR